MTREVKGLLGGLGVDDTPAWRPPPGLDAALDRMIAAPDSWAVNAHEFDGAFRTALSARALLFDDDDRAEERTATFRRIWRQVRRAHDIAGPQPNVAALASKYGDSGWHESRADWMRFYQDWLAAVRAEFGGPANIPAARVLA